MYESRELRKPQGSNQGGNDFGQPTMKTGIVLATLLLAGACEAQAETRAFVNVNVISMSSDAVDLSRTVIVSDGIITTIGDFADTPVPDAALVVDGTDRYLIPGLAEMHGHVPGGGSADLNRVLTLYVANGVTTVRGMLGQPSHLDLRDRIAAGEVLGPRLITSGPSFNGRSVSSPQAGARMVSAQHAAGYDFLKIHPGLTREEFDAIAETANELGIRFAGHVPEDVGVERALQAGIATIDHLDGYMQTLVRPNEDTTGGLSGFFGVFIADLADESKIRPIAEATAAAGTWNVPTESLFIHVTSPTLQPADMAKWPEMRYMSAATVDRWQQSKNDVLGDANYSPDKAMRAIRIRQHLLRELHRAGAGLLLGSDSPQIFNVPGFSLHRELGFIVEAGLSPYEALKSGTVNPAVYFGREDTFGQVREGLAGDLVLLDANPLESIGNTSRIHGVMLRGRWLSRSELDELLGRLER
jgi:imidazolonepropionase-like amidohydrolase